LRHARIERWSRIDSAIHRRHAAAGILATLALLISIATLNPGTVIASALYFALLISVAAMARLPLRTMLWMAATVLPFALCFAAVSALAGDPMRALWLLIRAYLSSFAALLLIATTPMPRLIAGLEWLRAPQFLLQVMQFLYRYLVVLIEEANAMRQAAEARAWSRAGSLGTLRFRHAAAAAGALFARAYARAHAIHSAMLARGFNGHLPAFAQVPFRLSDGSFLAVAVALIVAIRTAFR
jgi:cobalt/nickel transport system permease protein